ncbi:ATP-binding protein [Olsenella profusa]|nr:ATP-binding protein [Olsenella profusa]
MFDEPDEASKMRYLENLVAQTYLSDVVERNDVLLPEKMAALFDVLCSTTGSLVSTSGLAGTLQTEKHVKITDDTVYAYIQHLEDAFLFERARRYDIKGKAYLKTPAKYYPEDVGLRNAQINFRQNDVGFGIESVVYNELRRRGYALDGDREDPHAGIIGERERHPAPARMVADASHQVERWAHAAWSAPSVPEAAVSTSRSALTSVTVSGVLRSYASTAASPSARPASLPT